MHLKSLCVSTVMSLIISTSSFALTPDDMKPNRCPSIDVIKYRSLLYAQKDCSRVTYSVQQFDRYGTSTAWIFMIHNVPARDPVEALDIALTTLPTLSGSPQPEEDEYEGGWKCEYDIGENQKAHAYTFENGDNFIKILKTKNGASRKC